MTVRPGEMPAYTRQRFRLLHVIAAASATRPEAIQAKPRILQWIATAALPPRDDGERAGTVRNFGGWHYLFARSLILQMAMQ